MPIREILYSNCSKTINNVSFTKREMDTIACILNNRGEKKIASLLAISPSTVRTHIRNIMQKLRSNSRENIIDFMEKAGLAKYLRQYYCQLIIKADFEKQLQDISFINKKLVIRVNIKHDAELSVTNRNILNQLKLHLSRANITVTDRYEENIFTLFIITEKHLPFTKNSDEIYLLFDKNILLPSHVNSIEILDFTNEDNYYGSFIILLTKILNNIEIIQHFNDFHEEYKKVSPFFNIFEADNLEIKNNVKLYKIILKKIQPVIILLTIACINCLMGHIACKTYLHYTENKYVNSIRNDLILPNRKILLDRPHIIKKIDEKFDRDNNGIKIVVLKGIGGSGKTTVARQYAKSLDKRVVWEVNSLSEDTISYSFEQLAYSLCNTAEETRKLTTINDLKKDRERKNKLMLFLSALLKNYPDWFIIYNDVKSFQTIQDYFPHTHQVWGKGRILITTSDSNIVNNSYIPSNNIVRVKALSEAEKFELFSKVLNNPDIDKLKTQIFLKSIFHFPLDILIAASYIKIQKISYEKYLNFLSAPTKEFIESQRNLLVDSNHYTKTRNQIINLSIGNILNENPEFFELLLLVSTLNPQNIPKDLLVNFKNETTVNNFLYNMKKYSLISENISEHNIFINLYSYTQSIILDYLKQRPEFHDRHLFEATTLALQSYMENDAKKHYNIAKIKSLILHIEKFSSHIPKSLELTKAIISHALSNYYFYTGNYKKAKKALKYSVNIYKQKFKNTDLRLDEALIRLGSIYISIGQHKKAYEILKQGLVNLKLYYGENDENVAVGLVRLASATQDLGKYNEAKNLLKKAIEIYKKKPYGDRGMAWALIHLGNVYKKLNEYEKAKIVLKRGIRIYKNFYGEAHPGTIWGMVHLGKVYKYLGKYKQAKKTLESAVEISTRINSENNIETAWALGHLGGVYLEMGNYEGAEKITRNVLTLYKKFYGENHLKTAKILKQLGQIENYKGNLDLAEELIHSASQIFGQNDHPNMYIYTELLGDIYIKKYLQEIDTKKTPIL